MVESRDTAGDGEPDGEVKMEGNDFLEIHGGMGFRSVMRIESKVLAMNLPARTPWISVVSSWHSLGN